MEFIIYKIFIVQFPLKRIERVCRAQPIKRDRVPQFPVAVCISKGSKREVALCETGINRTDILEKFLGRTHISGIIEDPAIVIFCIAITKIILFFIGNIGRFYKPWNLIFFQYFVAEHFYGDFP